MKKKIYLYKLTDYRGTESIVVTDDCGNSITIGGYDAADKYQQFDSQEAWHSYEWAAKHGFKMQSSVLEVDLTNVQFN